jgi:CRP-like cAMP-binding protein
VVCIVRFIEERLKMVDLNGLKSIILLNYLKDSMLDKLLSITSLKEYRAGDYIFKEGDDAKNLYAVIEGKVALEIEKNSSTRIFINDIINGMTFGFSALVEIETKNYTSSAKALTDVNLYIWKVADLEALFSKNHEMGFLFMKRIAKIIKTRLQIRNIQLLDIYK